MQALAVRPIAASDRGLLQEAFAALSPATRYQRFHGPLPRLSGALARQRTDLADGVDHYAVAVFEAGVPETAASGVGVARFVREPDDPGCAEVAITLADRMQGRGLAQPILTRLARAAHARGIRAFSMYSQADNQRALRLVRRLGARPTRRDGPISGLVLPLSQLLGSQQLLEARA